jgi:hypothetical protein
MLGKVKKITSALLAAAIVWTAPGLGAHAFAAALIAPVRVQTPVGGTAAMGAVGAMRSQSLGQATVGALNGVQLGTVLPGNFQILSAPKSPGALALPASTIRPAAAGNSQVQAVSPVAGLAQPSQYRRPPTQHAGVSTLVVPLRKPGSGPGEISQSLSTVRARPNRLGMRFRELQAAFTERRDARLAAGRANPSALLEPGVVGHFSANRAPDTRLNPYQKVAAAESLQPLAPSMAPRPLQLTTNGLAISIAASARTAIKTVAGHTGLRHMGDFDMLSFPQDYDAPRAQAQAEKKPEPRETGKTPRKSRIGLGRVALMLIGSLVVAQVGVEAFGAAMPSLIQKTFGDFTVVAQLAIAGSFAAIAGRQVASFVVRKLGLKKSYISANGVRLVSMSLMAGLLAVGIMPLWAMGVFYAINGAMLGISMTALESMVPAIQGQDAAKLEKFWTWEQTILELAAIVTPIATGALVASMGFMPALIAFPVAMLLSLAIVWKTLKIPQRMEQIRKADLSAVAKSERGFFGKLTHGARMVWSKPVLRYSFLAYTFYVILNPFLYTMLAPAFGLRLMPSPELAASVQGFLTGFYSLGGLIGGLLMIWEQARIKKTKAQKRVEAEAARGEISDEAWAKEIAPWESERLRKSLLRWLLLGIGGLALITTLAFPMGTLGSAVALPAFLSWASGATWQAVALMFFGISQVVSVLKLRSYFQSKVPAVDEKGAPANNMADAMGFFGSASLLVSTFGLMGLKLLFQGFGGFTPFVYLAWGMAPLALLYLLLRWKLSRASQA